MPADLPQSGINRATIPRWAEPFLGPARYKSAAGGRGAARTHTFAQFVVMRMAGVLPAYPPRPVRVAMARQFQVNIKESCKAAVEAYIHKFGFSDEFKIGRYEIDNKKTGSHAFFPGFNRSPRSLMSTEGVDILWIEQAETLQDEMELIVPTIRAEGSELWFSWNPTDRTQWCWQRFAERPRPDDVIAWCNWDDNPWFPENQQIERLKWLEEQPETYPNAWLGQPDDGNADTRVLAYSVLAKCVEAWDKGLAPSVDDAPVTDGGFDLAYGGADRCSLVIRQGPTIQYVDEWPGVAGYLAPAAGRAHEGLAAYDADRVYYDATGGDTVRGEMLRLDPDYLVRPENFGGKVLHPKANFETRRTQEQVFARRNSQMAFALRLRANRTVRLLNGDDEVDPAECLFIRSDIPRLEQYLGQLTQVKYRVNPVTGKIEIDKRGDENAKSPDKYDATALAFARDSADAPLRARL